MRVDVDVSSRLRHLAGRRRDVFGQAEGFNSVSFVRLFDLAQVVADADAGGRADAGGAGRRSRWTDGRTGGERAGGGGAETGGRQPAAGSRSWHETEQLPARRVV